MEKSRIKQAADALLENPADLSEQEFQLTSTFST